MGMSDFEKARRQREAAAMWLVAYVTWLPDDTPGGWCVVDDKTHEVLAGPHNDHADAVEAVKTRAYRLAQGWTP